MLSFTLYLTALWNFQYYVIEGHPLTTDIGSNASLSGLKVQPDPPPVAPSLDFFLANAVLGYRKLFLPPISMREPDIIYSVYADSQKPATCESFAETQAFDRLSMIYQNGMVTPKTWMTIDNQINGPLTTLKSWSQPTPYQFPYLIRDTMQLFRISEVTTGFTETINFINRNESYKNFQCRTFHIYKVRGKIVWEFLVNDGPRFPTSPGPRYLVVDQSSGSVTLYRDGQDPHGTNIVEVT